MDEPLDITLRNETRTQSNYCELYKKIQSYFDRRKFTDVTITSKDAQEFKCHGLILAAASEYFDATFRGNWRENHEGTIKFGDVNGATFELFRQFAYGGMMNLNDENVYAALRLSNRCGVHTLERLCVRYITERSIPTNCAIELFVFAGVANKPSLIPPLRDFILNHLRKLLKVTGENVLLRIDLDDLKSLLTNRKPQSQEREEELRKVLVHWWVSKKYPTERSVLGDLVPTFKSDRFDPPRDFIRQLIEEEDHAVDNFIASFPVGNTSEELLHMYVMTKDKKTCNLVTVNADFHYQSDVVALGGKCVIKTATIGNQLYLYALQSSSSNHCQSSFSVYSSVRLTDERMLKNPANKLRQFFFADKAWIRQSFDEASICSDSIYKRIYLRQNWSKLALLFCYDCEADTWSSLRSSGKEDVVAAATFFDHRLYTFGCSKIVEAYDPRAGTWDKLRSSLFPHRPADKFCSLNGKLYATCERERVNRYGNCYVKSEVYDPVAGEWREVSPTSFPQDETPHARWLVSLRNRLWMIREMNHNSTGSSEDYRFLVQSYDSLIEKWSKNCPVFPTDADLGLIRDVVVSKSDY